MPVNEALMRAAVAHIELDERALDMGEWVRADPECGTAMCLAGHALVASGMSIDELHNTDRADIRDAAKDRLGLCDWDASLLFSFYSIMEIQETGRRCGCCSPPVAETDWVVREVTLADLKAKITEVTGIVFKTEEDAS